jgi:protein O-GlcNAc transferase
VIYDDRIDILIDLGGAAQGHRAQTFACRPAPIQVTGWGYPHGLGIKAFDYLVADPVAIPESHADRYPEKRLELPCIMGYVPGSVLPELTTAPQSRLGYRTYGYLGRAMKVNGPTLALWAEVLRGDPTGRLLLKSDQYDDRQMRERVVNGLTALGVEGDRIEIRGGTTRTDHLAAYRDVDVCLDPTPCGSGQTTLDACLMGVPTVSLLGAWVSGRITASIQSVLGMPQWATDDRRIYVGLAQKAAAPHWPNRHYLRDALLGSILVDGQAYALAVEAQYRRIWREWAGTV